MSFEIVTQKIELENASLNILMAGEGEAVVLIPSWARGADDFTDLMKVLAESRYRLIAQLSISKSTPNENWWRAGTAPMLIIQGLDDLLAPPANGRILRDKLGDRVKLVELEDTAHALLPEQPKIIAQTILDFISK